MSEKNDETIKIWKATQKNLHLLHALLGESIAALMHPLRGVRMKKLTAIKSVLYWLPVSALAGAGSAGGNDAHLLFAQGTGGSDDDTVRVRRRRRAGSGAPGERERADAPQRRRPDSGTPPPSGGMGGMGSSPRPSLPGGGGMPGGGLGLIVIIAIIILGAIFGLPNLTNQSTPDGQEGVSNESFPTAATAESVAPTATRAAATPTRAAASQAAAGGSTPGQKWTVMLYQDADDKILEKDIYVDLNEAERTGSTDRVNIVAQVDRYRGGFNGDGDWTSTKRFHVTQDDDLERSLRSRLTIWAKRTWPTAPR
jgi:hypothetical protein